MGSSVQEANMQRLMAALYGKIHEDAGSEDRIYYPRSRVRLVQKGVQDIRKLAGQDCPKDEVIVDWLSNSIPKKFVTDMVAIMFAQNRGSCLVPIAGGIHIHKNQSIS